MALPPDVRKRLEEGEANARADFEAHWTNWTVRDVGRWIHKWCRPQVYEPGRTLHGTNYDRVGRIIVDVTGVKPESGVELSPEQLRDLGIDW